MREKTPVPSGCGQEARLRCCSACRYAPRTRGREAALSGRGAAAAKETLHGARPPCPHWSCATGARRLYLFGQQRITRGVLRWVLTTREELEQARPRL